MRFLLTIGCVTTAASLFGADLWKNLDEAHYLAGRKASNGYLRGKVVLVDRWGAKCPPCRQMLPAVENIWQSFKSKPFVVLGGHCGGWGSAEEVQALAKENSLTYSIYEDAGLVKGEPKFTAIPFLYVVDETGKVVYMGRDERIATQAIVTALTDMEAPKDLKQFRRYLDFEIENLPGRALLRLKEMKKSYPKEYKEYAEKEVALKKIPDVKKLVEFVEFAKKAKDPRVFTAKEKGKQAKYEKLVKDAIGSAKYKSLFESEDSRVVQEAKNALADLKWTAAGF